MLKAAPRPLRVCGDRIPLFPETRDLWVVQISSCLAEQDGLRQQSFPPQSE
jgi:hypothetical protein